MSDAHIDFTPDDGNRLGQESVSAVSQRLAPTAGNLLCALRSVAGENDPRESRRHLVLTLERVICLIQQLYMPVPEAGDNLLQKIEDGAGDADIDERIGGT